MKIDVKKLIDGYIHSGDWRVKENSNIGKSYSGLMLHTSSTVNAKYVLSNIYPENVSKAHINGDIHIHDLGMGTVGYCAGWSISKLLYEGFNGVDGKVSSNPPKHLDTALIQMLNFLGTLQNEWAGAQAFNSIDTYLAPYIRADKLSYKEVKQNIQTFIFNLNIASRWGSQTPFTNLTLDWTIPKDIENTPTIVGGNIEDTVYGDYQEEADMFNRAFIEVLMEGDMSGRPFTFPIPTYNITDDFNWDSFNADLLFKMTAKYGLPYFSNFINSSLEPSDIRSLCCHLRLDNRKLKQNITGGLFGNGDQTGSLGVVTINMPRIGHNSKDENGFFSILGHLMDLARKSLLIKRKMVQKHIDSGFLPYTKRYLGSIDNHFSTIGLVGMNEACEELLGVGIVDPTGKDFSIKTLEYMRAKLGGYQEKDHLLYNLEATPAEGTSNRLARLDKKYKMKRGTYTNSTMLPVDATDDLFEAIEHQESLQSLYNGGTVFHTYLGERLNSGLEARTLLKKMMENSNLPYITITPTFSICSKHSYISGEVAKCPKCGAKTEVYSRVVGYFRPIKNWNKGKQREHKSRTYFNLNK